jgi:hypothetical protein
MSNALKDSIAQLIAGMGLQIRELGDLASKELLKRVAATYMTGTSGIFWERLKDAVSKGDPAGWVHACEFIDGREALAFFDPSDELPVYEIARAGDMAALLGELPPMEFYLTDTSLSFLLCVNDHDCIIGCGAAAPWVAALQV